MREFYACLINKKTLGFLPVFLLIFVTNFKASALDLEESYAPTLVCNTAPIITCPPDYTGCPGDNITTAVLGTATAIPGATDCDTPIVGHSDIIISTGPCSGETYIKRSWYAYDPNDPSLISTCLQSITLIDDTAPVITNCPSSMTVSPTEPNCDALVTWNAPTATDNCSSISWSSNYNSGDYFPLGTTTTVTYIATDGCGNESVCSFNITVAGSCCFDPPNISCPSDYKGCPLDSTNPTNTGSATGTAGGSNCLDPVITYNDHTVSVGPCTGATVIERTWIATDPQDPTSQTTCLQTITLEDTTAPDLDACPLDISVESTNGVCAVATWTAPSATDNCTLGAVTSNFAIGFCFPIGTTTVIYTATDNCGNTSTCDFEVVVEDASCQMPPLLTCPSDYFGCPGTSTNFATTGNATAQPGGPNCGNPSVSFDDVVTSTGPCSGATVIERTWTAVDPDDASLTSTCLQIITLEDIIDPVISNCPNNINLDSNDGNCVSATWTAPTASDNYGLDDLTSNFTSGHCFPVGTTTVTYTATDDCGNTSTCQFNVIVEDLSCQNGPNLICPPDYLECPGSNDDDPKITGLPIAFPGGPNCGIPLVTYVDEVISTGNCGDTVIERTWTATDSNDPSFTTTCVQTISFSDTTDPVMTPCPSNQTLTSNNGNCVNATWTAPTATDNCGTVTVSGDYSSGDCFPIGTTTVTYTATDDCGNTTTCSFTILVVDGSCMTPPTITCPSNDNGCPTESTDPNNTGTATAAPGSANCANPIITYTDVTTNPYSCSIAFRITRTWKATDPNDSSLFTTCEQIINRFDNIEPTISCPANQSLSSNDGNCVSTTWTAPTATDNCNTPTVTSNYSSGDCFPIGTTTVTYTATDACGNVETCSFTIEVIDNSCMTPPTINCPSNYLACPSTSSDPATTGTATGSAGSSNCSNPIITYNDVVTNPTNCTGATNIVRTWTATDPNNASLFTTCDQIIELKDIIDPTITCPTNIEVDAETGLGGSTVTWTAPSGNDNCGVESVVGTHSSGDFFPIGTTTVTYTVEDICGNQATCSFTITVNPNFEIHCPDDQVVQCEGSGGTTVTWELPTWKGGCNVECTGGGSIAGFIYMGTYGGHHYYCSNAPALWLDAQATCVAAGGYLASVNSAGENAFIANFLTTQSAYIGLSDYQSEGIFTWTDGSTLGYTNWYPNQPNNYNNAQHFCEMLSNGQWNDQYGKVALEYVLEIPCNNIIQTSGPQNGTNLSTGTHTVCYQITDDCGNSDDCCFDIEVESSISISCPDDVTFTVPTGSKGVIVNWNTPQVHTCCSSSNCYNGTAIPGFVYMGNYNGSHYYCSLAPAMWNDAQAHCVSLGGHLAIVNDLHENSFIASQLINQSAYIGCTDEANEGTFTWVDGSSLSYTNWYPGQPNNYNNAQHYCEMLSNGQWNDQYGKVALEYVMEIPACNSINQISGPPSGSYFGPGSSATITYEAFDACGNSTTCDFTITIEASYCNSGGQNSKYVYIDQCGFGPIDNHSGNNGGYGDFTNTCYDVEQGQDCAINLTPGFGASKYTCYWKIYCDWNNDYDFLDAGELCAYGAGSGPITGNYTITGNAFGSCRLRVVMKYGSYPTGPCEIFPHGETEDYCINVVQSVNGSDVSYREEKDPINLGESITFEVVPDDIAIESFDMAVYPNPASNYVNIDFLTANDQEVNIEIVDAKGQVIKSINNIQMKDSSNIDVNDLPSGIYVIKASTSEYQVSKRLVVSH